MGGLADGLALDRPLVLHGFPLAAVATRRSSTAHVVLMLALAEMLARGGERVGMPGLAEPRIGRDAADRLAEVLAHGDIDAGLARPRSRRGASPTS